jgi:putative flippase GtrA
MTKNGKMASEVERKLAGFAKDEADFVGSDRPSPQVRIFPSQLGSTMVRLFLRRGDGPDSYIGSIASSRWLKFLVVGGIGVIVNLLVMALVFQTAGYRDWRASAIASAVAALHNYLLNNHWTFADRRRSGHALFSGAFLYLPMSAVGVAITTAAYSILAQAWFRTYFGSSSIYLFGVQLVSISLGTYLNYSLNKLFTWRSEDDSGQPGPGKAIGPLASEDIHD